MGTTTFSGPIKAGTVREGASANAGFVKMAQSAAWTQTAASAATTSIAATELFTALAVGTAADVIKLGTSGTITDMDAWADVGTSDVTLYVLSSANTTGRGIITVEYIQNNNLA